MLKNVLSYRNIAFYCNIVFCVMSFRICSHQCWCADCLNDLFWCKSDEMFCFLFFLLMPGHKARKELIKFGFYLNSSFYLNYRFQPSALLSWLYIYTYDWRREFSGVFAFNFLFQFAVLRRQISHVNKLIQKQADSSCSDPLPHVGCSFFVRLPFSCVVVSCFFVRSHC